MRRIASVLAVLVAVLSLETRARAFEDFVSARPLGMGGASRAFATGAAGPLLNPSGMSLARAYHVEADYGFSSRTTDSFFHASIVDSTSAFQIAGGLYYTYHLANPEALPSGHGHEGGLALSLPLADFVAVGGTLKYFSLSGSDLVAGSDGGLTFDLGATVRPSPYLSLALVGANLRGLENDRIAHAIGYGVALIPISNLTLALDGQSQLSGAHAGTGTSIMAGADFFVADRFALRAGGGYDGRSGNGYGGAGVSVVGEIGAFDVGVRQDVFLHEGAKRLTLVTASVRLFVPATQSNP